ncbi:Xylose operon regulatory protein [Anatilimnocola aggregata]|uniref:Xylose operon regulatory protein n=1 Tax=Anatilimnocola aggregata TaxID=2528021 RepID=A0A517Y699_9BACT|nr:substrate-binding domain-containing protein [Anatilimnocola aggregata]QDU25753.1 Xylose operon regulatory protein [Anatilimnocola aggregata]
MPQPRRVALMLDLQWPLKRHAHIFAGTQRYADEQGWESLIDEYADEHLAEESLKSAPYDGVIGRVNAKLAACGQRLGLPLVNVWFSSPVREQLPGVFPDMAAAGRLQAEHLLSRGLRRFAVLTREDQLQKLAAATFRAVVNEAGFECSVEKLPLVPTRSYATWQKAEQRIEAWMDNWQLPIGVSICTEEAGRLVVQLCRRRGWRVPGDVAIIAGTNEEILCEHPRPSLSSIEMGYERIGYEAARLLDQLMDQLMEQKQRRSQRPKTNPPPKIILPPQGLIVRESTDFYAVDDEIVARALYFISANCHRPINCDDVARELNIETRTLQRRFRQVVDWPIADEIRRVRIERAKRELTQTKRSLAEIARAVGFGERMRLYEVFCRELGITPSEYRKQRRLEPRS